MIATTTNRHRQESARCKHSSPEQNVIVSSHDFIISGNLQDQTNVSMRCTVTFVKWPATPPVPKTRVAAHTMHIVQDRHLKFGRQYLVGILKSACKSDDHLWSWRAR